MPTTRSLNCYLTVRVTSRVRTAFQRKAERYGKPSDVMRELVEAFLEDRLTIVPPVNRKESLYVPGNQN